MLLILHAFFLTATASTTIYTLSLHDALPISRPAPRPRAPTREPHRVRQPPPCARRSDRGTFASARTRSEEHTSELQSHVNIVCRLLLEKKKEFTKLLIWRLLPTRQLKVVSTL